MRCPKCKSDGNIKYGMVQGVQRYRCRECKYNYTVEFKSTSRTEDVKRQAIIMYMEGFAFRSISKILKVSHVSVFAWVKKYAPNIDAIRNTKPIKIIETNKLNLWDLQEKNVGKFEFIITETSDITLVSPPLDKKENNYE